MMKTTQKAIRETCATDITNYSFDQANDLTNAHTLRTVAMSFGVYGMNGHCLRMKTGSYIKSLRETVHFSRCAKITLYKPAGGLLAGFSLRPYVPIALA